MLNGVIVQLFWCGVVGLILFAYGPADKQELTALKQAVERLQRTVEAHEHTENIEGVWVTDAHTFCAEFAEAMTDEGNPDLEIPYP